MRPTVALSSPAKTGFTLPLTREVRRTTPVAMLLGLIDLPPFQNNVLFRTQ